MGSEDASCGEAFVSVGVKNTSVTDLRLRGSRKWLPQSQDTEISKRLKLTGIYVDSDYGVLLILLDSSLVSLFCFLKSC